jgi:Ni/Co efflux regulator RcnB
MARLVALVLGLAVVAWVAKTMLEGKYAAGPGNAGPSEPKKQLDQVKEKTKEIERQLQRNADGAERRAQ